MGISLSWRQSLQDTSPTAKRGEGWGVSKHFKGMYASGSQSFQGPIISVSVLRFSCEMGQYSFNKFLVFCLSYIKVGFCVPQLSLGEDRPAV